MSDKTHLILYAAESIKSSDVHTFRNAAMTLKRDYDRHYPTDTVIVEGFHSGEGLVKLINQQAENSIISLDIVSHGNQGGIHISRRLSPPKESPFAKQKWHLFLRGKDHLNLEPERSQTQEDAEYMEESIHGLYSSYTTATWVGRYYNQKVIETDNTWSADEYVTGIAILSNIDFSRFADQAFVEFHGCRVAEKIDYFNAIFDNFSKEFSDRLPKGSIVVGHINNNFPDKHPNGNQDDYRHNKVRIYESGMTTSSSTLDDKPVERWELTFAHSSTPPPATEEGNE